MFLVVEKVKTNIFHSVILITLLVCCIPLPAQFCLVYFDCEIFPEKGPAFSVCMVPSLVLSCSSLGFIELLKYKYILVSAEKYFIPH